jgi:ABC-type sulfate transport system permease component
MFPRTSRTESVAGRFDWLSVAFVLGAVLLCYYLLPLLALVASQPPGAVLARLDDPEVLAAARTSLLGASASTVIATVFGLPLAYWLARTDGRLPTVVTAVVVLPLVLPPVVSGMVLLTVVGPNTLLGGAAGASGFPLTRSLAGVVLAQTFVASPFVVVTAKAAIESVDLDGAEDLAAAFVAEGINPGTTADLTCAALYVALRRGVEVVCGTPGRMEDLMNDNILRLNVSCSLALHGPSFTVTNHAS